MKDIAKLKKKFLGRMRGWYGVRGGPDDKEEQALTNSVNAALLRGYVYSTRSPTSERELFKSDWKNALRKIGARGKISEKLLVKEIEKIAADMSRKHKRILAKNKMRIGTSQKALNLYLKYLWCLDMISEPPHCPLDGIILKKAGVPGSWTKSNSIAEYKQWVAGCRETADKESLSVWELRVW